MKTTLVLCTTHRGMSDETYESVVNAQPIAILKHKGSACIDIARSVSFDRAVATLEAHPQIDCLLNVDDDMVFTPEHAQTLVDAARKAGRPMSGRYATINRTVAAMRSPTGRYRYPFPGLGFVAIPRAAFLEVAATLPRIGGTRAWCRTGEIDAFPGAWSPEDLWFAQHFGGIELHDGVTVGHLKTFAIAPKADAGLIQVPPGVKL